MVWSCWNCNCNGCVKGGGVKDVRICISEGIVWEMGVVVLSDGVTRGRETGVPRGISSREHSMKRRETSEKMQKARLF